MIDFHELHGLIAELLGLLGLLGMLEGVIGFLALLGGGLNHVVHHARRSETSADLALRPGPGGFSAKFFLAMSLEPRALRHEP